MARSVDFVTLLDRVQQYISERYAAALADKDKSEQLRTYIEKYIFDYGIVVEGMPFQILSDKLYCEMAEYSVLTKYLGREDIEEININGWNDIAITYTDGHIEKAKEHFYSPQHAIDVVKRLLHHSGMIIDNATPISQGHLPGNTRITALKDPIVDHDRGISVSIRLLHPSRVDKDQLVRGGNATQKMVDFLCMCLRYGVSFVVAGATSSGKTTLLNALLSTIPNNKRIFTIESGSRELSLVRFRDGMVTNNVIHTLSRPSENSAHDITQEDLVVASLRFNPDIVVVGEMRDTEAYSAVEASLTGHTVVSTIHASAADTAHMRLALLCQKRFPMRSREISVSIIIQNMAQLKALFEKQWESIVGNCDTFLYLGGNEQSSHKYVSELLGKETIDINTFGNSRGRNGNYTKNFQLAGRDLMTPDEVRMLDNRYALLFIRGEFPIKDLKYDITRHPYIRYTTDGAGVPYVHGQDTRSIATLTLDPEAIMQASDLPEEDLNFVLFCEEELDELFSQQGGTTT